MNRTTGNTLRTKSVKWGWFVFFVLPAVFVYTVFVIYPMIAGTFFYSLHSWNPIRRNLRFMGLKNFRGLLTDPDFYTSFLITLRYVFFTVFIGNIMALLLSMAIESSRLKLLFRNLFFIPYVVSGLIIGYLWRFIFLGVFPDLMRVFGLTALAEFSWYSNSDAALFAVLVIPDVWKRLGFLILLYIAGLQAIPGDVLEASIIDGANIVQQKIRIVIPMLMSTISTNLFISISDSFKQFELAYISLGGPGKATKLLSYNIYRTAFGENNYGEACAIALILMVIIGIFTFTQLRITGRQEVEQ
jgi:raffinose/stachyose/melibiose transport system permease protein